MKITTIRKTGGQYCSAIGCSMNFGTRQDVSMFSFPNPKCKKGKENAERSKQWVINCRRQDLLNKSVEYLHRNCCFCAKHFEDDQFMNANLKKRLVHDAVPTIFPEIPNAGKRIRLKRLISTFEGVIPASVHKKKPKTSPENHNSDKVKEIEKENGRNEEDSSKQNSGEKRRQSSSCLVENCKNNNADNPEITLFSLPIKNEKRWKKWLENIGKPHLISRFKDKPRFFVCEEHFEPSQIINPRLNRTTKKKRLLLSAVPTLLSFDKSGKWVKNTVSSNKPSENSSTTIQTFTDNSTQTIEPAVMEGAIHILNSSKFPLMFKCDAINRSLWRCTGEVDKHVTEDDLIIELNLGEVNFKNKINCNTNKENLNFTSALSLDCHSRLLTDGLWNSFKQNVQTDFQLCTTNENGEERITNVHFIILSTFCSSLKNVTEKKFKLTTELKKDEIDGLLEFLYCGRIDLPKDKLDNVLKAGKELGFKLLIDNISKMS